MQFLSDVYLRCGECDGRRYRAETLQVRLTGATGKRASIADVLDMTATEALAFFADAPAVCARLQPLVDVGLDYVRLGQPVPTLSGGEAQRLKLAGHLAEAALGTPARQRGQSKDRAKDTARASATAAADTGARGKLLIFDEPTTGLHFEDIARLVRAFGLLLQAGHSLLVIEHNLDVIRAADWIIDLGPEGGERGGELVAAGTPEQLMQQARTRHGSSAHRPGARRLCRCARSMPRAPPKRPQAARAPSWQLPNRGQTTPAATASVVVRGAREHNLKNVDVEIPRDRFSVITGVSGSGKSTLAFDILFNEGQRRYLESLNAYARQFVQPAARPDLDAIHGIPPTVAIEQRASRGGLKSTVATLTEIYHFLRLIYVRLGHAVLPGLRSRDRAAEPRVDRRHAAARLSRADDAAAGAVDRAPQGTLPRAGALGRRARRQAAARRRQMGADRSIPEPQALRRARHRTAGGRGAVCSARRKATLRAGRRAGSRTGQGRAARAARERRRRGCSARDAPAHPAAAASRSPIRACCRSTRARAGAEGCFGTGVRSEQFEAEQTGEESQWLERRDRSRRRPLAICPDCARRAPQPGGAASALPRNVRSPS